MDRKSEPILQFAGLIGAGNQRVNDWRQGTGYQSTKELIHLLLLTGTSTVEFFDLEHVEELPDTPKK